MSVQHYIFGYGSLINSSSRRITGVAGDSVAVRVAGLERTWVGLQDTAMRAVAVCPKRQATCNGVLFQVPEVELEKFDERETHYVREQLDHGQIGYLDDESQLDPSSVVWVYLFAHQGNHLNDAPIVQSYLDVIVLGCQEINATFASEFIEHTQNWEYWHDDRHDPVYPRAQDHNQSQQIDQLLGQLVPLEFTRRVLSS